MKKVSEIIAAMKENELVQVEPNLKAILVSERNADHPNMVSFKKLYLFEGDKITETYNLEKDIEDLVQILADNVDVKELLRQQLLENGALGLHRMAQVLREHPEVHKEIRSRPGCLYLQIPNPNPGQEDFRVDLAS